jgi:heat shock protein 90kDa beta
LSAAETKLLRESAEKFEFQAEVNRMMQLIINSLYKNKEVWS